MKTIIKQRYLILVALMTLFSCNEEEYELNPEIVEVGALENPAMGENIEIDLESESRITFTWSPAKSGDGGLVTYNVLFDKEGGDFEDPLATYPSANSGSSNTLNLRQSDLNQIASEAGIGQLETGNIIWTVEAVSSYNRKRFSDISELSLQRPEGFTEFPEYMYVYGPATEAEDIENAVAFGPIENELPNDDFEPGTFESITKFTSGEFYIVDSNDPNSNPTHYYINEEGKIRTGDEPTNFEGSEGVYRIRMNLSRTTISYEEMSNVELYILANGITTAELSYVGNHTFESTNGYFDFLTPGAPNAPDWLGWEEERYRFRFMVDGVQSYIGSFHNSDMNGSLVSGLEAFNARPNEGEPEYYYNTYFLGPDAEFWQGAWKFADQYNGASFTVRIIFDPTADHYYHEFELN